ncbi:MAG: hypothetical protein ACI4HO_08670 [Ruminococcus sp.]
MLHIKITVASGAIISAEAIEAPVYVRLQTNGVIVRCSDVAAQGVVSADGSQIYQFADRPELPGDRLTAERISQAEYDEIIQSLDFDPDADPDGGSSDKGDDEGDQGDEVMDITTMRRKITEQAARLQFLEDCLLEISEDIYA